MNQQGKPQGVSCIGNCGEHEHSISQVYILTKSISLTTMQWCRQSLPDSSIGGFIISTWSRASDHTTLNLNSMTLTEPYSCYDGHKGS